MTDLTNAGAGNSETSFKKRFIKEVLKASILTAVIVVIFLMLLFAKESDGFEGRQGLNLFIIIDVFLLLPILILASLSSLLIRIEKSLNQPSRFKKQFFIPVLSVSGIIITISITAFSDFEIKTFLITGSLAISYILMWGLAYKKLRRYVS